VVNRSLPAHKVANYSAPFRIARTAAVALLMLSIVLPTVVTNLKISLLALALVFLLLSPEIWIKTSTPSQLALDLAAVAYSSVGLAWGLMGAVRGNAGAEAMLTVHAAYPVLFAFLCRLAQPGDFQKVSVVLLTAAALTISCQAVFLASFFGIDSGKVFQWFVATFDENVAAVDVGDDYVLFTLPTVSSLLFLAPWLCIYAICGNDYRKTSSLLLLLAITALMLSGRRVFLLALAAGCIAAFLAYRPLEPTGRNRTWVRVTALSIITALFVTTAFALDVLNFELLRERMLSIFDFDGGESNLVRLHQAYALMEEISTRPAFGSGLGAVASYVRSDQQPWAYELSYLALIFQFGIVGFLIYACGVMFLLVQLARFGSRAEIPRSDRVGAVCFLAGVTAFLLANATNPYLAKFDYMWVIFVPFAFVRLYASTSRRNIERRVEQFG
jgi:hypothetical protein